MKKIYTILIFISIFNPFLHSCASGKEYHNLVMYKDAPFSAGPIYIRSIQMVPSHSMSALSHLLPGAIHSILAKYGMQVTPNEEEAAYVLKVHLQRKEYQNDYEQYESITLTLTLVKDSEPLLYLIHTEDTPSSIDSFPLLCSILDENISVFSEYCDFNEEEK